jgi:peptidyl-prolyl cis-trans isomerase B (cyclophilin B)
MPAQPEPVARDKTAPPSNADQVRPPVAADLAGYVSDIPGNGNKLFTAIETSLGTFHCELFPDRAPMTVANFVGLATGKKAWTDPQTGTPQRGKPFFDGLTFHRVIPGFMVQGGDPLSRELPEGDRRIGTGGPGYHIKCETKGNPHTHEVGALSMAHAGKDTGGSQFFMVLDENSTRHLNGVHTVFGKITKGVDVLKQIKQNDTMTTVRVA